MADKPVARNFDPAQMRIVQSGKDKEDLRSPVTEAGEIRIPRPDALY